MTKLAVIEKSVLPQFSLADVLKPNDPRTALTVPSKALAPVLGEGIALGDRRRLPATVKADQVQEPEQVRIGRDYAAPIELTLPFGYERDLINAATFKALAGRPKDNLFRRKGAAWQIVDNSELIDLKNRSIIYKLGPVQIFS